MNCNPFGNFKCPCCGYYTFGEPASGTHEICVVCFWEDDLVQLNDPFYAGRANVVSLNEARENFKRFGAVEQRFKRFVRPPQNNEMDS